MRDPERLLSQGATEFERKLLLAAKAERPAPELQLRMAQALGFSAGTAAPVGVVAKAWHASWLKLGAGGLIAGGVVAGGLVGSGLVPWSLMGAAQDSEVGVATTEVTSPTPVPAEPPIDSVGSETGLEGAASAGLAGVDVTTLREEIELLDAVRREVSLGRTPGARLALDRYERRFPAGALQREAQVLRRRIGGAAPASRVDSGAASRR